MEDCIKCKRWKLFKDKPCAEHPEIKLSKEFDILIFVSALRVSAAIGNKVAFMTAWRNLCNNHPKEVREAVVKEMDRLGPMTPEEFADTLMFAVTMK